MPRAFPRYHGLMGAPSAPESRQYGERDELAAIGIYRGPHQVFEYANEEMQQLIVADPDDYLGVPVVERFVRRMWKPLLAVVKDTYQTGVAHRVEIPAGTMWVIPLCDSGIVTSVATHFVARRPLRPVLLRAPLRLELAV
jgi:hypothetical protein